MENASQEYATRTIIHEILHAYIKYDGGLLITPKSHNDIGNKYVTPFANLMHSIYPSLNQNMQLQSRGLG